MVVDMELMPWIDAMEKACRMMNDNPGESESRYLQLAIMARPKMISGRDATGMARAKSNRVWTVFCSPTSGTIYVRVSPDGKQHETFTKAFKMMEQTL